LNILKDFCAEMNIQLENVAIIGDDVNDMEVMKKIGFTACPADAMATVKSQADVILTKKGGEGCVREFIDAYLLKKPLS